MRDEPVGEPEGRSGAERVVALLELVASEPHGIGVREAARRTGMDRSVTGRLLLRLEELGCLRQISTRGPYVAADRLFAMAAAMRGHDSLDQAARPVLRALSEAFDETTYLAVRRQDSVVFRAKVDCRHPIRYVIELGRPFPLLTGATGISILCGLPQAEVDALLARSRIEQYTPSSLPDAAAFAHAVARARTDRYAVSFGRWVRNGAAIASPFFGPGGQCLGSVALNCPADRLRPPDPEAVGARVRDAAATLSRRVGYLGHWHDGRDGHDGHGAS